MAHEQPGPPNKTPWTKIFSGFKVALDLKKLLLAAAGILITCIGWQLFSWSFHGMRSVPEWKNYDNNPDPAERQISWNEFKARRASWNLLHELAGAPSDKRYLDAADVASDLEEFELLQKWESGYRRLSELVIVDDKKKTLEIDKSKDLRVNLSYSGADADKEMAKIREKSEQGHLNVQSLKVETKDEAEKTKKYITIDGQWAEVTGGNFDNLKKFLDETMTEKQIIDAAAKYPKQPLAMQALRKFKAYLLYPRVKASGRLRTWPWDEYRGPNPFLVVTESIKAKGDPATPAGSLFNWLFEDELPVLIEPLVKFLLPLVYLFDARAGGWDRLYLIFVILWMVAVWGFFGGAICRLAAVQVARNERLTLVEAVDFAREHFISYVVAPVFPLLLIALLVFVLMLFGWVAWIPFFGDVFAGIFWPIVILIGFIMAVVMVGLIGWPMMNATISTEGSDSFDALSRSYSYIYQAPWQYMWYNFLALVYGAVLVFFVGFMASMIVFVGKWGVSSAFGVARSNPATDREPSFLFNYAPKSFGWRDLLISSSQFVERKTMDVPVTTQRVPFFSGTGPYVDLQQEETRPGRKIVSLDFTPEYKTQIGNFNSIGAFLVAVWIYLFFLLVVGFGYSYFWTASTIVYFLMRNHVDDTDMDEVHLEDEGMEDPFLKPTPPPPAPTAAPTPGKPGTMSLNVLVGPPPTPSAAPTMPMSPPSAAPTAPPIPTAPAAPASPASNAEPPPPSATPLPGAPPKTM